MPTLTEKGHDDIEQSRSYRQNTLTNWPMLKESMVLFKPYFMIKASHKNNIIHVERITHKDEKKIISMYFFII